VRPWPHYRRPAPIARAGSAGGRIGRPRIRSAVTGAYRLGPSTSDAQRGLPMPTLLAKNAAVLVTMDDGRRELSNAGLFVRDGMIEQVGPTDQLPQRADLVLDLSG